MNRKINIPLFISHRGCPNDCAFCNQKTISGAREDYSIKECIEKIEACLLTAPKDCEIEISFFGGSFTGIPIAEQKELLSMAKSFFFDPRITGIRLSTRPDYIDKEVLDRLSFYGVTTIELGVQSLDNEVLQKNYRGMKREAVFEAVSLIRNYPFSLGLQMMTGLFSSTPEKDLETGKGLVLLKPDFVRIYPTVVLLGTKLYEWYQNGIYHPQKLDEAILLCATLYQLFEQEGIKVIRMGLASGDGIHENKVIGPYHSAFGELVKSALYYDKLSKALLGQETRGAILMIYVHPRKRSVVTGNKKINLMKLMKNFGFSKIKIIEEEISEYRLEIRRDHEI